MPPAPSTDCSSQVSLITSPRLRGASVMKSAHGSIRACCADPMALSASLCCVVWLLAAAPASAKGGNPDGGTRYSVQREPVQLSLSVPGAIEEAQVSEVQNALGVPVRLSAVRSKLNLEVLQAH